MDDALVSGLDGAWTTGQPYPSGTGAGGDFNFRVNVLRGDANGDGSLNPLDLGILRSKLNRNATTKQGTGTSGYNVLADLNADGQLDALDLGIAKERLNTRLPAREVAALW